MKTILITGTAGFIGMHVAQKILERGDKVIGIDNLNDYYDIKLKEARLEKLQKHKNFTFHKQNIAQKITIKENIDVICHLAAQAGVRYSIENPQAYQEANSQGMLNILEYARTKKIKHLVFASSSSVYGNNKKPPFKETDEVNKPISFYAATKVSNEIYAYTYHHLYNINITGLRFFTVYGPWGRPDMAPIIFLQKIMNNKTIDVYNHGKLQRDFTYIDDIVAGVVAAIDKPLGYEIINLARGQTIELMDFIKTLEKHAGKKANKNFIEHQKGDVYLTSGDINKAKKLLGYKPQTNINEGIQQFTNWYKTYYNKT